MCWAQRVICFVVMLQHSVKICPIFVRFEGVGVKMTSVASAGQYCSTKLQKKQKKLPFSYCDKAKFGKLFPATKLRFILGVVLKVGSN